MSKIFDLAFEYLMKDEGSRFTDDPDDSGGATHFGVTKTSYEHYLGRSLRENELENLSLDLAKQFYYESFWMPLHCEGLVQPAVAIAVFDTAVLYGPWFASYTAQKVANTKGYALKLDGVLGDKSREAINTLPVGDFLMGYYTATLERINLVCANDSKNEKYRKGWKTRADRLLALVKPITEGSV